MIISRITVTLVDLFVLNALPTACRSSLTNEKDHPYFVCVGEFFYGYLQLMTYGNGISVIWSYLSHE